MNKPITSSESTADHLKSGRAARYVGWALTVLTALLLVADAGFKLALGAEAVAATAELGFPASATRHLGGLLAVITALYIFPRTSFLGAIILTGYLGGAVAVHAQHGNPLGSHILFGVYVGIAAWAGLWLRSPTLQLLVPVRRIAAR